MPNYNEQTIDGKRWTRAKSILIDNRFGETPRLQITEEDIIAVGNETIVKSSMSMGRQDLIVHFNDPTVEFKLLHPSTDAEIGSATFGDIHVILYSIYRHLANIRDVPVIELPETAPENVPTPTE